MRRRSRTRLSWLLVASLSIAGTVSAADRGPDSAADDERRASRIRIDRERLVPRVSVELESLATFHRAADHGRKLQDHVLFEELSDNVRRGAERVTRRAVRNYLVEAINLDRGLSQLRKNKSRNRSEPEVPGTSRDLRFHVGIHSMLPEVGVGYRLGDGAAMRWTVGADGEVGVKLHSDRLERAEFSANFDGDDEFTLRARLAF